VQGVSLVSSSVWLIHLYLTFRCKTLLYQSLNQNCNILYSDHLIYDLYVCTYVFLLRQESIDMILINNLSFSDGGVTVGIRAMLKLRPRLAQLQLLLIPNSAPDSLVK
jgi:hypothetical protein